MSPAAGRAKLKVLVDTPRWFIRPQNTDWRYMASLRELEAHLPVCLIYETDLIDVADESLRYIRRRLAPAGPPSVRNHARNGWRIAAAAKGVDVVLSHRRFPLGLERGVIWQHAVLDPQMQMAAGAKAADVEAQYAAQASLYANAARVQVSSRAEAVRHARRFPELSDRFFPCPFFLPHIRPLSARDMRAKHADDALLRIGFIGRDARRKGLDVLLAALASLAPDEQRRIHLTVVTPTLPPLPGGLHMDHNRSASPAQVRALMAASHVIAMPSRYESFGFVLVEAMAQGCAVIGPDWEVQREILDDGAAGFPVGADVDAITRSLRHLISDRSARLGIASAALAQYHAHYSPEVVAGRHLALFESAIS